MSPRCLLLITLCAACLADGDLRTHGLPNLAKGAQIAASGSAGAPGQKYSAETAVDGELNTWWASSTFPKYPVELTLDFPQAIRLDTLAVVQADNPQLYSPWKRVRIEFSDGSSVEEEWPDDSLPRVVRFGARDADWVKVLVVEAHHPDRHYVTAREIMAFLDPDRKVKPNMPPTFDWKHKDLTPQGMPVHPCVYLTPEDVTRARETLKTAAWAQEWFEGVKSQADQWMEKSEEWLVSVIPEKGACFAYGFSGCPICSASWGTWGGARCSWDKPGKVTCANGHVLPDEDHPDPGTGYVGPDGRIHYFVGSYNAWVVETLEARAVANLALAYTLTGEDKYADRAGFILDLLADIYPSCDAGSWDYPSTPPSGRFCRPWYQVARVLVHYVDEYDQVFNSASLDKPSIREGMTRRENIELNLLRNGAEYCYEQSLKGRLHNGEADYVRGALAVGCCLGIPWYIDWAYDGPYGILSFVRNNVDRDGRYFETSAMYADHTRSLYLTFAEPLFNYRSDKYPSGINLYDDRQFQSFYVLPQLSFSCIGKTPRFGDSGPDTARSYLPKRPTNQFDYRLAERLYARVSDPADRAKFGGLLNWLSAGDPEAMRHSDGEMPWLLFHGRALEADPDAALDPRLARKISQCELFGQKGFVFLRDGEGPSAQALLLRYGPSLNHGHLDDLNINYYARGFEVTYDLGYGLGSTHTQVGWGRQTASHNLVLVDEKPQRSEGSGTGGSLHQFADLPGLKLVEASSENSYVNQGVSVYRRLLAMAGEGDRRYLVDLFRVRGGKQHDYLLHSFGEQATFEGVELPEPAEGSLAGPDIRWGDMQLNDGDMKGFPGRPYWNPPPGNGLGFLMAPQAATCDENWSATWSLPGEQDFLKATILGQPGTEVITARAPGIYPLLPKTRYAIARRKSDGDLSSNFVAILEPYGLRHTGDTVQAGDLAPLARVTAGSTKMVTGIGVLLFQAEKSGDEMTVPFSVERAGQYVITLGHYQSPSYGSVQVLVDGLPLGDLVTGTAGAVGPAVPARLGELALDAGQHTLALRLTKDDNAGHFWFGMTSISLTPAGQEEPAEPRPFITSARRLSVDSAGDEITPTGIVVELEDGATDVFLSAGDAEKSRQFSGLAVPLRFRGRFAHLRLRGGRVEQADLSGARELRFGDLTIACAQDQYSGTVTGVDEAASVVDVDAQLPADGRLNGQVVLFDNPLYSRNTAHRIARVENTPTGSRIYLESATLVLGTGILEDDPGSQQEFASLLAHEYATCDSADGTQFMSGKLLKARDAQTRVIRTRLGQLMRYTVESTEGFRAGTEFAICDAQVGDTLSIPAVAHVETGARSGYSATGNVAVTVSEAGKPQALAP